MSIIATSNEQQRLDALDRYDVLDTPEEEAFDKVTRLARRVLHVPMSTVTFIDGHRQWFKSRQGMAAKETARAPALCNYAIKGDGPLIIRDTLADTRFEENPFVRGAPHIRFYAGIPLRSPDGHNIGTLCAMDTEPRAFDSEQVEVLSDLARLIMDELELRLQATTDSLTGARLRKAFREEATRALKLAQRHRHEASLIAFDLDHFKAVNDTYGHAMGDEVLRQTADACDETLRQSDIFGRLGGEEFAVLVPHTGRASALAVAEKLRTAIAARHFSAPSGSFGVTASFGIASFGPASDDIDSLLQHADEALYAAKSAGRNRCVPWIGREEKPTQHSRRVLKAGQIVFNGGGSVIDCTVRRLSDQGADIDIISSAGIPARFKLRIEADDFSRVCDIAQKAERQLTVQFA